MKIRVYFFVISVIILGSIETAFTQSTGNLCVTVRNTDGTAVSGARVVRYNSGGGSTQGFTGSDGRICWNSIPIGSYSIEAYYTGTFFGEEYWGDASGSVNSGQTTNLTINRIYPYIESITIRNHSTGAIITSSQQIEPGTTVRAEIVVRNKVSVALNASVRLLFDRSQSSPYDSDQVSTLLSISSNSTRTYTFTYTPTQTGLWYLATEVTTRLLNGNTIGTDSWPWAQVFNVQIPTGNLCVTVRNADGSTVSGARVVRSNPDGSTTQGYTSSSGTICWNSIPTGSYSIEAYYTGTFFGEEYWGDASGSVNTGQTTNLTVNRIYPYIESIKIVNQSTGLEINPSQQIAPGTTVQTEIVVRNKVSSPLGVRVHLLFDLNQSSPFDSDQISSDFFSIGSNSTRTYTFTYTPTQTGVWYRATEVTTRLLNGNNRRTDGWPWAKVFSNVDIDLIQSIFTKDQYNKGETVTASFVLRNNSSALIENARLDIHFNSPIGTSVGGITSLPFTISPNSTTTINSIGLWTIPNTASSGAYLPVVTLRNSDNEIIETYVSSASSSVLPIIPIGSFPQLNSLIVKSQENFNFSDPSDIANVIQLFKSSGIFHLSLSVKLDDGYGEWPPPPTTFSGRILFNSSHITSTGTSPLSFDLYQLAQEAGQEYGVQVDPWFPTFYDSAAYIDHPSWRLATDPEKEEAFIDAYLPDVRNYEISLIQDLVQIPYTSPERVTIDHFRFTDRQHPSSYITTFVSDLKSSLPNGIELAGYMFLPKDNIIWGSGQDYANLQTYLDILSPMLYWQTQKIPLGQNVPEGAREWVSNSIKSIEDIITPTVTKQKVRGTLSISSNGFYNDGTDDGTPFNLDDYEWKRTQINVLGALGDAGIQAYDIFYWGNWLWPVDKANPTLGTWIERAAYLSSLNPSPPVASIHLNSPNGGESWQAGSNHNITWSSNNISGNVRIEYSSNNGSSWNTIAANITNSGSYPWPVPNTPSTSCLVRISDTDVSPTDQSNAVFTITAIPAITVTSPNGGENWQVGSSQNIIWTSTGLSGNVRIEYSTNNGSSFTTLIASTPDDGSYTWTIPNLPSTSCLVRVSDTDGTPADQSNGTFIIRECNPPAQPGSITGSATVCQGSSQTYSMSSISGATSYSWTLPSGWSGSSSSTSITATAGASGGTISVTANNSCGSSAPRTLSVSVTATPAQPGAITGSTSVCQGSSQTYSISSVSGATSYLWTLPSGWSGSSTSTSITATAGASGGTISVTANNSCGSGTPRKITISVNPIPPVSVIIQNDKDLESSSISGNQWYNSSGLIPGATGKIYTPPSNDNYYVKVTTNGCVSASSNIISFSVGIEKNEAFKGISIYPNPAKDYLIIENNEFLGPFDFEIVNSSGKIIYNSILFNKSIIDLNLFSSGIYIIRFTKESLNYFLKFIKD